MVNVLASSASRKTALETSLDTSLESSLETMETKLEAVIKSTEKEYRYPSPTHEAKHMPLMKLNEAVAKVKKLPADITAALKMPVVHHHSKHRRHSGEAHFLQEEDAKKKKGIEEALDKAKETLSNMMHETETELDEAIMSCKEYDSQTVSTLDVNSAYRAELAGMVAESKGMIAEAKMLINQATTELDTLKTISEEHARQCFITIKTQQDALSILNDDLAVSMKVENMTDCDDVAPGSTTTLMQCGTGYASRFKFAGDAARYDGFTQLKSNEGVVAVQRAAKMILKVDLGADSYGNEHVVPSRTVTRKGLVRNYRDLPIRTKNGLVQRSKKVGVYSTPPPEEVNRSSPLSAEGAEALVNMTLETSPEPVSYNPEDLMEKCTVSGSPSCPMLRDALSQLSAEVRWARDQAAFALSETEAECKRLEEEYATQNAEWEAVLESSNVKFAEATAKLNTAEENLRQKVMEANDLLQQLGEHRKDCAKKIKEGAETICGIKSIRQELYQMQSYNPFIQDCEVGEWQPGECSVECGGGERAITREVVTPAANGGAECPPMIEKEPCNLQPCPIDCVVGEWSEYSACSKDCGGGVEVRSRPVYTDAEHGGEPCGDLSEQNECNE